MSLLKSRSNVVSAGCGNSLTLPERQWIVVSKPYCLLDWACAGGPLGSPYFSAYVFFLYECLKSKVYIGCPENIVELKCHIQEEILAMSADIP